MLISLTKVFRTISLLHRSHNYFIHLGRRASKKPPGIVYKLRGAKKTRGIQWGISIYHHHRLLIRFPSRAFGRPAEKAETSGLHRKDLPSESTARHHPDVFIS